MAALSPAVGCVPDDFLVSNIKLESQTTQANVAYHIQHVPHGDQALACKRRTDISKNEADDFIFSRYD